MLRGFGHGIGMQNVLNAPQRWYEPLFPSIDEAAAALGRALEGVTLP
jgi:hypothetical protein